ncbi:MAG: bifunctional phosphopantothenoylcysteine decarboxylase/phosphopantothenate--cysteine ligase CoaBC [bacterium]
MSLQGKKILIGLTGGIACYKVVSLIRLLRRERADTRVVMTRAAGRFVTPLTLETISGNPVAVEMFPDNQYVGPQHIDLAEWADLMVVAPATANFLGKAAAGIADDLLTAIILAGPSTVLVAPAMNPRMWGNRITQRNCATLQKHGFFFVGPGEGEMACEQSGVGRMAEPQQIFDGIDGLLGGVAGERFLAGKKILVTAGPTRERLDPVRYLSNFSSGRMGFALAQAAVLLGAETTLIAGPSSLQPPAGVGYIGIESAAQLRTAVKRAFKQADCLLMAAVPADFAPTKVAPQKRKKSNWDGRLSMRPTVDILQEVASGRQSSQVVVGFALETENALANARRKLKDKQLDLLVLNRPGKVTGFESPTNRVTVLIPGKSPDAWPLMSKNRIAVKLLEKIAPML